MYSCYDVECDYFVASLRNFKTKEQCVEESFDYATEDNDDDEVLDWIKSGGDKEGALMLMNFQIRQHDKMIPFTEV